MISVRVKLVLWLGLRLGLMLGFRFTFCLYYVSTKPTAFSSCVTVMLQEVVEKISNLKIHGRFCRHCL